jgi:hypothetical protein
MTRGRVLRLKELHLARAVQSFTGEAQVPAVRIRGTSAPRRPLVCDRQSRADGRRTARAASEAGVFRCGRTTGPQPGVGARVPCTNQ